MQDIRLQVRVNNTMPMELSDLTSSLTALNNQYVAYIRRHRDGNIGGEAKLYVKEVRKGSAIFELTDILPAAVLPFMENANTIIGFAGYIRDAVQFLLGINKVKPDLNVNDCRNISDLFNPITADNGGSINVGTVINGDVTLYINTNSTEANAIQNAARREIKRLSAIEQTLIHERVIMTWLQTNSDINNNTKNKGVIDSVLPGKALKILFEDEVIKRDMLYGNENPLITAYVVDVKVETSQDKPVAYRIVKLHEKFEI
jgi:hypothetical protein